MGGTLTEQRRVKEEGIRFVNFCYKGRKGCIGNDTSKTVLYEEATANYVPAAAVIRRCKRYPELLGVKREQAAIEVCGKRLKLNFSKPWKPDS